MGWGGYEPMTHHHCHLQSEVRKRRQPAAKTIKELLAALGLAEEGYEEKLAGQGITSIPDLQVCGKEDLQKCGILVGHAAKIINALPRSQSTATGKRKRSSGSSKGAAQQGTRRKGQALSSDEEVSSGGEEDSSSQDEDSECSSGSSDGSSSGGEMDDEDEDSQ